MDSAQLSVVKVQLFSNESFTFLSFDEVSGFHESLTYVTQIKWVYIYFPFFVGVNVFFLIVLKQLVNSEREVLFKIYLGLLLFAGGGLFLEWVYYRFGPLFEIIDRFKFRLEEGFELLGIVIAFTSVLSGANYLLDGWKKKHKIN
jgi:hypothetical protein